ncbi:uncharacterized protein LOC128259147 isoform X3 [Drosophila gunungcola]|uniref:uncharacterized protein LOC128259147 isoform X3 n=1 Tax=Drosophila gunungcola TaxID=103775 RepID=UPI0022E14435|nr:uncharacterized protein LOC128259147 isoform X3 [Drosophila gunungcola]
MLLANLTQKLLLIVWISKRVLGQSVCSDCSLTSLQYACINETAYGFCFGQAVVDESRVRNCRDGYYCVLQGFCAAMDSAEPACVPDISTTTTDIVTDSTTQETTESTVIDTSTSPVSTDSTTIAFSTDSSTDSTTPFFPTEILPDSTTSDLTTDSSTMESSDSTTLITTDSTTPVFTTDSNTQETTESTVTETSTPLITTTPVITTASSTDSNTSDSTTDSTTSANATDSSTLPTTFEPTSTSTLSTSTISSEVDPNVYCAKLRRKGHYRVETDTTCQMYVFCYKLSQDYLGRLYYCEANQYYNSDTEACQTVRPSNC